MKQRLKTINRIAAVLTGGLAVAGASAATPASASPAGEREAAVRAVAQRMDECWARNDAAACAAVFTRDVQFVIGEGTFLNGRSEYRAFMEAGFAGFLKGARATTPVTSVRFLKRDVAVMHTRGGILLPGETVVPPERLGVQVWVLTKHRGRWLVATYQNTRICESSSVEDLVCTADVATTVVGRSSRATRT